jgi:asparagine synthase (glutamine-hydrolysing)
VRESSSRQKPCRNNGLFDPFNFGVVAAANTDRGTMCGFSGELAFNAEADSLALLRMTNTLRPRGPDAGGLFLQEQLGLGHRRLCILDLSAAAQQPMLDPALGLGIVFNGCVYNFRELRQELERAGYRFFSAGDTEVVLKAYHAWGRQCVERFLGMFAFAIWERGSGRLFLARDRLGIKPLYYSETNGRFRFASTLPALLAGGDVDTSIDPVALHHYLSLHSLVPPPFTIIKGVRKLPSATTLTIESDGSRQQETYWTVAIGARAADEAVSEAEWKEAVLNALRVAVKRRLVSDVPAGVLLSGGRDSSLIVALVADSAPVMPETFSIGFEAAGEVAGDEFEYSDLIAEQFGTKHHRLKIEADRTLEALPHAIEAMSEPMMSHDCVAFYLLSQAVSKSVKVVQSGQGADEVFGGYHWYPKLAGSTDLTSDYAAAYFDRSHEEMREALTPDYLERDYSRELIDGFFSARDSAAVEKALELDQLIMLADDPVKRVDNMTMAWGLEARVPFLDHELAELAARIPARLKVKDGGKYILKEAARHVLPAEVIDRPKGYFPVPALKYIRGPFFDFVRNVLTSARAQNRGLFNKSYISRLLSNPEGELTPKGNSKLWQVAVLEYWLQAHGI